jgi:hypothetical protein
MPAANELSQRLKQLLNVNVEIVTEVVQFSSREIK